jgi:glycine/D-amino acid oxidase-like deaminating enzyme
MDLYSGTPLWPSIDDPLAGYPALRADISCDILVIGAGISGALTAARLVEHGHDVVVIDARDAGRGSTCVSTCLLLYELDIHLTELRQRRGRAIADKAYQVSRSALDLLEEWVDKAGGANGCGYRRKPSVYFASTPVDVPGLRAEAEARLELGIECRIMEAEEFSENFSFKSPLAILSDSAAECDVYRLTHGLLEYARSRGARIYDSTRITSMTEDQHFLTALTAAGLQIIAGHAVVAAGYESQDFLKQHVARNVSTFAFASKPVSDFTGWWQQAHLWETARPYCYLRTTADGRIIMGGEDEPFDDPVRRDACLVEKICKLQNRFRQMFPAIPLEVEYAWAGTFAETKDGLPRIGKTHEWERVYFAMGYGGNGITYSAIAADMIAAELLPR